MQSGNMPAQEMLEGIGLIVAGAFLLTPGFFYRWRWVLFADTADSARHGWRYCCENGGVWAVCFDAWRLWPA